MPPKLTNQEIFNTVSAHLLQQNCKSTVGGGVCKYKGPNNTYCAVGILLKDLLTDEHEGKKVTALPKKLLGEANINFSSILTMKLLGELQEVHDFSKVETWREELKNLGKTYGLDTEILT